MTIKYFRHWIYKTLIMFFTFRAIIIVITFCITYLPLNFHNKYLNIVFSQVYITSCKDANPTTMSTSGSMNCWTEQECFIHLYQSSLIFSILHHSFIKKCLNIQEQLHDTNWNCNKSLLIKSRVKKVSCKGTIVAQCDSIRRLAWWLKVWSPLAEINDLHFPPLVCKV